MKCKKCGTSGFSIDELNDYYGNGILWCGPCCDDQDIIDKNCDDDEEIEDDEDEISLEAEWLNKHRFLFK